MTVLRPGADVIPTAKSIRRYSQNMKRFSLLTVAILAMIISACGTPAAPTMNGADVQNTAVAAAFTMVAQTQAAVPTATPLPPTEAPTQTPLPSLTPITSPTLDGQNSTPVGLTLTPQTNIPTFTPQASG